MNRILTGLLAGAAALALAAAGGTTASAAQPVLVNRGLYAALGDSFAAGVGNPTLPGAGTSGRSASAYPVLLAEKANRVTFLAASGAATPDVMAQVEYVPGAARQLTVTVGGNDGAAFTAMGACLYAYSVAVQIDPTTDPQVLDACAALFAEPAAGADEAQIAGIAGLLTAIQLQAPRAKIYVTGYPMLFDANGDPTLRSCTILPLGTLPGGLFDALDGATAQLNAKIESAVSDAASQGVDAHFVPVSFAGHGLCDGPSSWVLGPEAPAPLHPTPAGQAVYAEAIIDAGFVSNAPVGS